MIGKVVFMMALVTALGYIPDKEAELVFKEVVSSHFIKNITLDFNKRRGYFVKTTEPVNELSQVYTHSLSTICSAYEDFVLKKDLMFEILRALSQEKLVWLPGKIDEQQSTLLFLYLQTFRYMIALYVEDPQAKCPEPFISYLKVASRMSMNAYSWNKIDRKYYSEALSHKVQYEKTSSVFKKVKQAVLNSQHLSLLGQIFQHKSEFKRIFGLLLSRGIPISYSDWVSASDIKDSDNDKYLFQGRCILPGLDLITHVPSIESVGLKVEVGKNKMLLQKAGRRFEANESYGFTASTSDQNEQLLAIFGYTLENNERNVYPLAIPNKLPILPSNIQDICKTLTCWDQGSFEQNMKSSGSQYFLTSNFAPNNRLMNYMRILHLNKAMHNKTTSDLVKIYRQSNMFSGDNEIRSLSSYYTFINKHLGIRKFNIRELRETYLQAISELELETIEEKEKQNLEKVERLINQVHILKVAIESQEIAHKHRKVSLLKLGLLNHLKLEHTIETVSYTHLTLPTILLVQISVVAVSLKKKNKKLNENQRQQINQISQLKLYNYIPSQQTKK
eukprot:TRINITY_DN5052_c0_g1_i1.p1 TRINITY_DN5052_c0_g1~~TRINITY_DN5052_c0_g1_i1.p1  ORF type:complete len:561 (+),score=64.62 TRINITY_DN5052_c0_g1_i1:118-1800(+)